MTGWPIGGRWGSEGAVSADEDDVNVGEGAVRRLNHGAGREVLFLESSPGYVLKIQEVHWEQESNGHEYYVSNTCLNELMPATYGLVHALQTQGS